MVKDRKEEEKIKREYGDKSKQILDILKKNREKEVKTRQEDNEK